MGVVGMLAVRRAWLVVVAVILSSCGPAGLGASPADIAPYGADAVSWPTEGPDVLALLEALPDQFAGLRAHAVESGEDPAYRIRRWGGDANVVAVAVSEPFEDDEDSGRPSVAASLEVVVFWLGGRTGCTDWTSSAALMPQELDRGRITQALADGEFVWLQCNAVLNIDRGGTLPPEQQSWEFLFVAGKQLYGIESNSRDHVRDMAQLLVATAQQTPGT